MVNAEAKRQAGRLPVRGRIPARPDHSSVAVQIGGRNILRIGAMSGHKVGSKLEQQWEIFDENLGQVHRQSYQEASVPEP